MLQLPQRLAIVSDKNYAIPAYTSFWITNII